MPHMISLIREQQGLQKEGLLKRKQLKRLERIIILALKRHKRLQKPHRGLKSERLMRTGS